VSRFTAASQPLCRLPFYISWDGRKERRILFHEYYDPAGISVCEWPFHFSLSFSLSLSLPLILLPPFFIPGVTIPDVLRLGFSHLQTRPRRGSSTTCAGRNEITVAALHPLCTRLIFYGCQTGDSRRDLFVARTRTRRIVIGCYRHPRRPAVQPKRLRVLYTATRSSDFSVSA